MNPSIRFIDRSHDDMDQEQPDRVVTSPVEVLQPSSQVTVLVARGLWAKEHVWTVIHNGSATRGTLRILRADCGIKVGSCEEDPVIDVLRGREDLLAAMSRDVMAGGHPPAPELVASWVARLEHLELQVDSGTDDPADPPDPDVAATLGELSHKALFGQGETNTEGQSHA